jgi:hypothetical protein
MLYRKSTTAHVTLHTGFLTDRLKGPFMYTNHEILVVGANTPFKKNH